MGVDQFSVLHMALWVSDIVSFASHACIGIHSSLIFVSKIVLEYVIYLESPFENCIFFELSREYIEVLRIHCLRLIG